ncbi:MFS transporter [Amycolatopsis regifaucium]|uniref:MFS transporter n=1 Tax=Amycolatopsis regifaucium TaxID=546365 RepID=A0A154MSM9_9PSEU|nr:MFS transporter [Amycolatopsis regifaucium]KZB87271.1 MFS transporter [Amycolatopsis regifaucium]OKA08105.1 MFS transporter [Amycolatopsis regifaucium]SFI39732.1 Predicted arabinose efflux permease, MFS family [Amycolatopsis regifaucium]
MFSSLKVRNYRLFFTGQVISNIGTWMQRIAQDWLVFTLSGNNPIALGIAVALQFLPTLFLSLWAGVLADRVDKRRLLIGIQIAVLTQAIVLGVLDLSGIATLWQVYVLCFTLGCTAALEVPARQSFVAEMVGRDKVTNAVALNSSIFNMARIVGPAIAGFAITWVGTGWLFIANALSTGAVIAALAMMNPDKLFRGPVIPREKGQLVEGLRYVRRRSDLMTVMVLVFFVSTFGITYFTSLPIVAANVFHTNADGYGLLSTLVAVGTFTGALMSARRNSRGGPRVRLLLISAFLLGAFEVVTAFMPTYLTFGLALIPLGFATITFLNTANALVQTAVSPEMRGRVMGLYVLVLIGGNPVGGPMTGWMADAFGGRSPFYIGGAISALAAVVCAVVLIRRGGVRLPVRRFGNGLRVLKRERM